MDNWFIGHFHIIDSHVQLSRVIGGPTFIPSSLVKGASFLMFSITATSNFTWSIYTLSCFPSFSFFLLFVSLRKHNLFLVYSSPYQKIFNSVYRVQVSFLLIAYASKSLIYLLFAWHYLLVSFSTRFYMTSSGSVLSPCLHTIRASHILMQFTFYP